MNDDSHILQEQPQPRIRFRYLILISSVLIFVILGIGLTVVYQDAIILRNQIKQEFNDQQQLLARQAAMQVTQTLRDIRIELNRLERYRPQLSTAEDYGNTLIALVEHVRAKGVIEGGIYRADGRLRSRYTVDSDSPPPSFEQVRRAQRQGQGACLGAMAEMPSDTEVTGITGIVCIPWLVANGADGFLYTKVNVTDMLAGIVSSLRPSEVGYSWVIDQTGRFLFHTQERLIGRNAFVVGRGAESPTTAIRKQGSIESKMVSGREGTGSCRGSSREVPEEFEERLVAFAPIADSMLAENRWSVAVSFPVEEVAAAVDEATSRHITAEIAIIVSMVLFGGLIFMYERRVSRSLSRNVVKQQKFLSTIMQYSMDAIILVDNQNRIVVWNKGAELLFGYTADEMVGQTFHRIIPPEMDAEKEIQRIRNQVLQQGYIRNHRAQRYTKDGRRVTIDLSRTQVRDANGEPLGSVAILRDVTEEFEFEQRMYNTEKLASIGTLAAGVAHEINNPLAIIQGFTDLLEERFPPDSQERADLKIIEDNVEHAKKTVEDLLGFARVSEGDQQPVDVNESLQTVINIVYHTLPSEKIDLVTEITPDLPRVSWDAREFQQVVFNLINNAVAAMKEDGGTLKISAWVESRRVCVRVTDTGTGIPDPIKRQIFDPFFTTKRVGEGTGLGLSLCYGIVKKYGGSIDFFSHSAEDDPSEPSGSSFTVTMPISDPTLEDE